VVPCGKESGFSRQRRSETFPDFQRKPDARRSANMRLYRVRLHVLAVGSR
jgi:hypothetical protein